MAFKLVMKNILITLLCLCLSFTASASKEDALLYFQNGQKAFNEKNYEEALKWLNKATSERNYDGDITIQSGVKKFQWIKTPRGRQRVEVTDGNMEFKPYFPHQLISNIAIIKEEQRKRQASKEFLRKKYSNPPNLVISYHLSGDKVIEAKERTKFRVVIENIGGFQASDVKLVFNEINSIELSGSREVGEIAAGDSITQTFDLIADKNIDSGILNLAIMVQEKDGFDSQTRHAQFQTLAYLPPKLKLIRENVTTVSTNLIEASYTVVNVGQGKAFDVKSHFVITDEQGGIFFNNESDSRIDIGDLRPNQNKEIKIQFFANNRIKANQTLPFKVKLTEQDSDNNLSQTLALMMPKRSRNTQYAYGAPTVAPVPLITNHQPTNTVASVDFKIPQGAKTQTNSVALVIGNANYDAIDNVDYATKDAVTVAEYVKKTLGYGSNKVKLVKNMTSKQFTRQFGTARNGYQGKLFKRVKNEAMMTENPAVFIYYSGHGAPSIDPQNPGAFFVPTDIDQMTYLADEGYSIKDFYASIRKLPTNNVTVVIDSCFSGNTGDNKMLYQNISPALLKTHATTPSSSLDNATIFTSASSEQVSNWYAPGEHSLFTYHFLAGLSGNADSNGDSNITLAELERYIKYNVNSHTLENDLSDQTPNLTGDSNKILATLAK